MPSRLESPPKMTATQLVPAVSKLGSWVGAFVREHGLFISAFVGQLAQSWLTGNTTLGAACRWAVRPVGPPPTPLGSLGSTACPACLSTPLPGAPGNLRASHFLWTYVVPGDVWSPHYQADKKRAVVTFLSQRRMLSLRKVKHVSPVPQSELPIGHQTEQPFGSCLPCKRRAMWPWAGHLTVPFLSCPSSYLYFQSSSSPSPSHQLSLERNNDPRFCR